MNKKNSEIYDHNRLNNLFPDDSTYVMVKEMIKDLGAISSMNDKKRATYLKKHTLLTDTLTTNALANKFIKKYTNFSWHDDELYYNHELLVVPPKDVEQTIDNMHSSELGNHDGIYTLYKLLQTKFIGITVSDVRAYLEKDVVKQISEKKNRTNKPIVSTKKNGFWAIDLIDLHSLEKTNRSARYVMNIVDVWSRYCWLVPLKEKNAELVLEALTKIVDEFGPVGSILSDNGTEFKNSLMKDFYKTRKIKELHTMSYSPESNGIVERKNRDMRKYMRKLFIKYETTNWVDLLPEINGLLNMQYNSSVKEIPHLMYFGEVNEKKVKKYEDNIKKRVAKFKDEDHEFELMDDVRINLRKLSSGVRRLIEIGDDKKVVVTHTPQKFHIAKVVDSRGSLQRRIYIVSDDKGNLVRHKKDNKVMEIYSSDLMDANGTADIKMSLNQAMKLNGLKNDIDLKFPVEDTTRAYIRRPEVTTDIIGLPTELAKKKTKPVEDTVIYGLTRERRVPVPKKHHSMEGH